MYNITFQQLATFFAVAERMNITEAASALYISQSSVSKTIQRLEEGIEVKLFVRTNRGLTLTPAGEYLYANFRTPYNSMCKMVRHAKSMTKKKILRIGYPSTYDSSEDYDKLKRLISDYAAAHPDIELDEGLYDFLELKQAISFGDVDIAFTHDFIFSDLPNVTVRRIFKSRVCLAMSAKHPLAALESEKQIDRTALENEVFYTIPFSNEVVDKKRTLVTLSRFGITPKDVHFVQNFQSLIRVLRQGKGMSVCGYFQKAPGHEEIRFFDMPPSGNDPFLAAAWRTNEVSGEARDFIGILPDGTGGLDEL
ncbi:DNA-binding transcriptional regulator, LysR family [Sporobacter termitidis DSM 10068]|uniref:DNA-binding transcriptional regulator, LysR family n=1 Tax=Sporobacter termitidis DSM 10068 TaxID=1123282 RepID=A0A1M5TWB9_9FIRM|nr:LysR family transcriptional regulator [Sporobacter termitidis]SHH54988.1 DNA-binding transcriptional regulator, LysR family [Sporobacter termitidis DSM 10068]